MNKSFFLFLALLILSISSISQNSAIQFDGVDDYVEIVDTSYLDFEKNDVWTIELWFKTNSTRSIYQSLISKMGTGNNRRGYDIGIKYGSIFANINNTHNSNFIRIQSPTGYSNNVYHHVAVSYNGNSDASGVKIYIDGIDVTNASTIMDNSLTATIRNNFPLTIGSRDLGTERYDGLIDDVRIWSVVRTSNEIISNYNSELSGLENNLIAYYKFDNDTLTSVIDCSNLSLNGNRKSTFTNSNLPIYSNTTPTITNVDCGFCDSDTVYVSDTSCFNYTSPSGKVYSTSGNYIDTIPNSNGCDSLISISVNIKNVVTTITNNGISLTADEPNAVYQWIDCSNNVEIQGATSRTFTPATNGSYSVKITKNGCFAKSNCETIISVGIAHTHLKSTLRIFPNPSKGIFSIDMESGTNSNYKIFDIKGRIVLESSITSTSNKIDLSSFKKGIYFVQFENKSRFQKLILH